MSSPSKVGDIVQAITYESRSFVVGVLKSMSDGKFIVVELSSKIADTKDVRCGAIIRQMRFDEVDSRWLEVATAIQRQLGIKISITAPTSKRDGDHIVLN
ncbi:hypothetical protein HN958_01790 [Candidatus Falkowbacteria bacterium]|jgi:hypothetical protein|nr:hypothetical protein [Candidatus Falkowbacteria bacterium]MBT7007216.1 hypothetical protein [Candidatus Falkowbacteria bacterium]